MVAELASLILCFDFHFFVFSEKGACSIIAIDDVETN